MSEFENALSRLDDDLHPVNYELYVYLHGVISQAIELEAQLDEVRGLPEKWRRRDKFQLAFLGEQCADDLEEALQGEKE